MSVYEIKCCVGGFKLKKQIAVKYFSKIFYICIPILAKKYWKKH